MMSNGEWIRRYTAALGLAVILSVAFTLSTLRAQDASPYVQKTGSTSSGRQVMAGKNGQLNLPPGSFPAFPVEGDIQAVTGLGLWQYSSGVWRSIGYISSGVYVQQGTSAGTTVTAESFTGGLTVVTSGPTATVSPTYGASPSTICQGNDLRLYNSRSPTLHASTHEDLGADQIPLDKLAAPTNNTSLNVSTSNHGLMPILPGDASKVLSGAGTYIALPTGTVTAQIAGTGGAVSTENFVPTQGVSITGGVSGSTLTVTLSRPPDVVCGGRLSRVSTNLSFQPFVSDALWCYESGAWTYETIPDSGITSAATGKTASTLYYVYAFRSGSALSLDVSTTTTVTQNGIPVKSGAANETLVALAYANASGAITTVNEDASTQLICNIYNKQTVPLSIQITTASWTYNSVAWRSQNGSNTWRVQFVSDGSSAVECTNAGSWEFASASTVVVGIGLDTTSATSANIWTLSASANQFCMNTAYYCGKPTAGYHFAQAVERLATAAGATTIFGQTSNQTSQAGLLATVYQ